MLDKSDWTFFLGLGSCAIGGIVVYCYKNASWHLKALQKVEEFEVGDELYKKVESSGGRVPYVAVHGLVSPDDAVLLGKHVQGVTGVIHNIKVKEHKSKWNPATKAWHDSKRTISSSWNTEPFSLINRRNITAQQQDSTSIKVNVQNPRSAYTLKLSKISDNYGPIGASAGERVLDYVTGEQIKGIQTVEKMLLVNSALTAIGEVSLTPDGRLTINFPSDETLRYYLTTNSLQDLINSEKGLMITLRVISVFFFIIGGAFSMYWFCSKYEQYAERERFLRSRQQMDEFNERNDNDGQHCTVCLSAPRDVVILPCGHICICSTCSLMVDRCPVCRGDIQSKAAVFYS